MTRRFQTLPLVHILVLLSLLLVPALSSATTFDFTGAGPFADTGQNLHGLRRGDLGPSIQVLHQNGTSVQIDAYRPDGEAGSLHRNLNGLGVLGDPVQNTVGGGESIAFVFSGETVAVEALVFERGNLFGQLELYVDDVYQDTLSWITGGGELVTHDLGGITGTRFELRGDRNGFRVASLTVAAVPEPSAALLFALGSVVASRGMRRVGLE